MKQYKIILPERTLLEEAAIKHANEILKQEFHPAWSDDFKCRIAESSYEDFIAGAKWQAENMAEWQQHNIKDPELCEHYKEVGCIKDICDCYTLIKVKPNKPKYEGNSI